MTRTYILIPCECELCILANTQSVRLEGRFVSRYAKRKFIPGETLHGVDATRYLDSQRRNMESVRQIGEQLRRELLRGSDDD